MSEHILVGLSSAPSNARIIRTAATMAKAFGGTFTALFVRTPNYEAMTEENRERLRKHTELAQELGATVETVFGDDVSYQIAEYARLSGVTKIVVGRSAVTRKHPWSKPTLTEKLTKIAPNLDIHIIPDASADAAYHPKPVERKLDFKLLLRDTAVTIGILMLATLIGYCFSRLGFTEANIITVYILGVVILSVFTTSRLCCLLASIASVLIFNFLFTVPRFTFRIVDPGYYVTFLIMFIA